MSDSNAQTECFSADIDIERGLGLGHWLQTFKSGDYVTNYLSPKSADGEKERAQAKYLYERFGTAVRDDDLPPLSSCFEWKTSDKPVLRLSPDLFEAVSSR
jgi:hypothetical protein